MANNITTRKAIYVMSKKLRDENRYLSAKDCDRAADMLIGLLSELEGCINSMANQANTLSTHASNIDRMLR